MFPLISPDVLADLRGLSMVSCGVAIGVGAVLWLFGWWGHRFWIVLLTTLGVGLTGLAYGQHLGVPPPVAGLLLALAAGMLALSLARIAAFVSAGLLAWLAIHHYLPAWDVPLVSFVVGGLVGVVLFRLWLMALTSLAGVVCAAHGSLLLAEQLGKLDASTWAAGHQQLLLIVCAGGSVAGVFAQSILERWQWNRQRRLEARAAAEAEPAPAPAPVPRRRTWWQIFSTEADYRRAA